MSSRRPLSAGHGFYECTATQAIDVVAVAYGTSYNIDPASDYTATNDSDLTGTYSGSAMRGATPPTNVQIVTQADIDAANKQIVAPNYDCHRTTAGTRD